MQSNPVDAPARYEEDYVRWLAAQAAAVRERRWADLDIENISEELDGLARSDRQEIASRLRALMAHLLKREAQPDKISSLWESTILQQTYAIADIVESSPSLRAELTPALREQYATARKLAATQTGLPLSTFPLEPTHEFEAYVLESIDA